MAADEWHLCVVALASNCQPEANMAEARRRLEELMCGVEYTSTRQTAAYADEGAPAAAALPPYSNQLARGKTRLTASQLERRLKAAERELGRTEADKQQGKVRIDLDLMLYDGERFHLKDWTRPYITALLGEIDLKE